MKARRPTDSRRSKRVRAGIVAAAVALLALAATAALALSPSPARDSSRGAGSSDASKPAASKAKASTARAGRTCHRTATSAAGLSSQFRAASPGQTICLASGDYGRFAAGDKAGRVTVRAKPGSSASLQIDFSRARNVRVTDVTVNGGSIIGNSRNITVDHSRFTEIIVISQPIRNPRIVLNRNTHNNIAGAVDDFTSRVHLEAPGVVVKNSLFSGGTSDGIRVGAAPDSKILYNEFTGFVNKLPLHTDPIQFYGPGPRATIRGNWFHDMVDVSAMIMMADGGGPHVIENNLFGPGGGHAFALTWYSDDGSIIRHNTFVRDDCNFNLACGTINLGYKPADDPGRGTVIEDNILTEIGASGNGEGGGLSRFSSSHNLLRSQRPLGPGDARGAPRYAGTPLLPNASRREAFAAYRLARGSRGRGTASDGSDRGIPRPGFRR